MKKPISLRAHLEQWVPDLAKNPDKLHVFIENGHVATKAGQTASFEYRYTLQLQVWDFSEPVDTLIVPILVWAQEHQPDLIHAIAKQEKAIGIEVEILDHEKVDIALTLDLSERVIVRQVESGYQCEHCDEPPLPDMGGPVGWSMIAAGEELA